MSLDLYEREIGEKLDRLPKTAVPDVGAFDGFLRGMGTSAMRTFAIAGRSLSLAAIAPVAMVDYIAERHPLGGNGVFLADELFKVHDEIFGSAVDAWTPRPNEVGVAGQMVGQLLATLPFIIASPSAAVGMTGLGAAEEVARKGVDPAKATAVGVAQAAGLGLGIWMPILGQNLWQRVAVGGAGFNVLQGAATRGASADILAGTPAAEDFKAFDGAALTLDVLLGLVFGSLVHLSPAARAHGAKAWERVRSWAEGASPSQVDALATLRQAQHMNVDSIPGRPADAVDVDAHVRRLRAAAEQLARGERVEVEQMPAPRVEPDAKRWTAAERRAERIRAEAEKLGRAYDLVLEEPRGPVQDPLVRLTPEEIGNVLVERGVAKVTERDGAVEISKAKYGLLKIVWKHGERSGKSERFRVSKADVLRLPEVVRDYLPIEDVTQADGKRRLEWQIEREDGQRVVYSVRRFTAGDREQHLVTMFVNRMDTDEFKAKPLSERRNRQPESQTVGPMPSVLDTGREPLVSSRSGQEGGSAASLRTEGPAGQPPGAESPPPRGSRAGTPAGPEADLVALAAGRVLAERPDAELTVGRDAEGRPVRVKVKAFLEEARAERARAAEDAKLFEIAAQCLLGNS